MNRQKILEVFWAIMRKAAESVDESVLGDICIPHGWQAFFGVSDAVQVTVEPCPRSGRWNWRTVREANGDLLSSFIFGPSCEISIRADVLRQVMERTWAKMRREDYDLLAVDNVRLPTSRHSPIGLAALAGAGSPFVCLRTYLVTSSSWPSCLIATASLFSTSAATPGELAQRIMISKNTIKLVSKHIMKFWTGGA